MRRGLECTSPALASVGAPGRQFDAVVGPRSSPSAGHGELGSRNPVVITPGALAARGATLVGEYIGSVTRSQGQLCTKPGLLFLPEGHGLDEYLQQAISAASPVPMLGPWIADAYSATVDELAAHPAVRRIEAATVPDSPARRWRASSCAITQRLERSNSPGSPSAGHRQTHLWAVAREIPIPSATCATGRPEQTRWINSRLP